MIRKYFIVVAVLLFSAGIVLVDSNSCSWADAQGEIREDDMVLEEKKGDCIIVKNRCYRISETTVVKDDSGETILPADISLPCLARLTYYYNPKENVFEVISVEILDNSLP